MDTTMYEFDPLEAGDPRTVGGYALRARIGAGGMGRVYLSFTPGGRAVAVKIIRSELGSDPEFRERFAREVSIAQQVNGIHIAQLIDAGSDGGVPWMASAYIAGPSLGQVVTAYGALPPDTVLALAARIAESLAAIHATGMVHRDLKPGNILLDESGPKVIDFGIVRAATPTATGRSSHRTFIGSPPFMAPEQIRGKKVTPATDVFALGATLYYLCTGESAFSAEFTDGVLYRVIHDEPDYDACPEEVRELIRVCLRKDPTERPSTQRIVDGCRKAGAGPRTPLPEAVRAMIRERAQALGAFAKITGPTAGGGTSHAEQTPEQMPGQMPGRTPEQTPGQMPGRTPEHMPGRTPGQTPGVNAGQNSGLAAGQTAGRTASAGASSGATAAGDGDEDATAGEVGGGAASNGMTPVTPVPANTPVAAGVSGAPLAAGVLGPPAAPLVPTGSDVHSMATVTPSTVPVESAGGPSVPEDAATAGRARGTRPPRRGRTAVAAGVSSLVTAIVAVVIAVLLWPHSNATGASRGQQTDQTVNNVGGKSSGAVTSAGAGTSAAAATTAPAITSTASSVVVSGSDPIQWHGHVMITGDDTDLDSVPVSNGGSTPVSIYDSSTGIGANPYQFTALPFGSGTLAVWSSSIPPTRSQCYDQVSSQGVNQVAVSDGTMLCVITAQDRVALLKVLDDQADSGNGILTDVTVWSAVSTASATAPSS